MKKCQARVIGTGSCLPRRCMHNNEFAEFLDTSDEWIYSHTGIKTRYIASEDESISQLAYKAALNAVENANIDVSEVDAVLVATVTGDKAFPACASRVHHKLGCTSGFAFDLQCACSGFLHGMVVANSMIASGTVKTVVLIGADTMSSILDWEDRTTCVLFGDGAGALVLQRSETHGVVGSRLFSEGELSDILYTDGNPVSGEQSLIRMNGRVLFRHAIEKMSHAASSLLDDHNISVDDVDWMVPHQANIRIVKGVAERISFPMDKILLTIEMHANTSAASIPLAMDVYNRKNYIKDNDLVLLSAFGSGLSWGALLMRW